MIVPQEMELDNGSHKIAQDLTIPPNPTSAEQPSEYELKISPIPVAGEYEPKKKPLPEPQRLVFVRPSAEYRCNADKRRILRNSMLFGVGFLECANAGDIGANIWNQQPPLIYAQVLMGIGGTLALYISTFAFKDARLSWNNIVLLQYERDHLRNRKTDGMERQAMTQDLDVRLDVNFRETGAEWVDRFGMDIIMGIGAVIVGVGTLMAIGGKNVTIFKVSNILSGYLGNGPAALWGLGNVAWCLFLWGRAQRHENAASRGFEKGDPVATMLYTRLATVKYHAALYGVSGFVAGIASLISVTLWWGYVILAPCLAITIYSNIVFRHKICYNRISIQEMPFVNKNALLRQLRGILSIRAILVGAGSPSLTDLNAKPLTLTSALDFILTHGLFEDFCVRIIQNPTLVSLVFGSTSNVMVADSQALQNLDESTKDRLLELCLVCIGDVGVSFISRDNEVFLLDTLACTLSVTQHVDSSVRLDSSTKHDIEMGSFHR